MKRFVMTATAAAIWLAGCTTTPNGETIVNPSTLAPMTAAVEALEAGAAVYASKTDATDAANINKAINALQTTFAAFSASVSAGQPVTYTALNTAIAAVTAAMSAGAKL